jgi:single-strand DNA-binding protein
MDIQGKVIKVNQVEHHANDFTKQTIIIETSESYPKKIALDFVKDKIEMLRNIAIGQTVKCHINIESKEFNNRYFTNVTCWKLETI